MSDNLRFTGGVLAGGGQRLQSHRHVIYVLLCSKMYDRYPSIPEPIQEYLSEVKEQLIEVGGVPTPHTLKFIADGVKMPIPPYPTDTGRAAVRAASD